MRGSGPADLLPQPASNSGGRLCSGKDVGNKENAPTTDEKVGSKVTIFVDDLETGSGLTLDLIDKSEHLVTYHSFAEYSLHIPGDKNARQS